jgi:hypothetical protein
VYGRDLEPLCELLFVLTQSSKMDNSQRSSGRETVHIRRRVLYRGAWRKKRLKHGKRRESQTTGCSTCSQLSMQMKLQQIPEMSANYYYP